MARRVIRPMLKSEAEAVASLFADAPEAAHWDRQSVSELVDAGAQMWVDMEEGRLAGALASRTMAGEAEILNLAVDAAWRRRGVGRRLMEAALDEAARRQARRVFLEVRESNAGARAFYARLRFAEGGRRRNYYRDPAEDALELARTVQESRLQKS